MMKEGYGGRAGTHQFDERVIEGVKSEDVEKRLEEERESEEDELARWESEGGAYVNGGE